MKLNISNYSRALKTSNRILLALTSVFFSLRDAHALTPEHTSIAQRDSSGKFYICEGDFDGKSNIKNWKIRVGVPDPQKGFITDQSQIESLKKESLIADEKRRKDIDALIALYKSRIDTCSKRFAPASSTFANFDLYVATDGYDNNSCSFYQPCKSIQKAIDLTINNTSSESSGVINLRGGIYRQSASFKYSGSSANPVSGTAARPIVLQPYNNEKVVVSGLDVVDKSLWKKDEGSIYLANLNPEIKAISQVYVDGQYVPPAQFPTFNPTYTPGAWLPAAADSARDTLISGPELSRFQAADLKGAGIHIRTQNWYIENNQVADFDSTTGKLALAKVGRYAAGKGWGYYLDNKRWMLSDSAVGTTAAPGWVYERDTNKLFIRLSDNSAPSAHSVEISYRNLSDKTNATLAVGSGVQWVTIKNIAIVGSAKNAITLGNTSYVTIDTVDISKTGTNGIFSESDVGFTQVIGSNFHDIASGAITFKWPQLNKGQKAPKHSDIGIISNTFQDIGKIVPPTSSEGAILFPYQSDRISILNNTITNASFDGIIYGRNSRVIGNTINKACLLYMDCGGIYTFEGLTDTVIDSGEVIPYEVNSVVSGNTVSGLGVDNGTLLKVGAYGTPNLAANHIYPSAGIYLDMNTKNITITKNHLFGNERGIHMDQGARSNTIEQNLVENNYTYQLSMLEGEYPGAPKLENTVQNNYFIPMNTNPTYLVALGANSAARQLTKWDCKKLSDSDYHAIPDHFGAFEKNIFSNLQGPTSQIYRPGCSPRLKLADWQKLGYDD